jgi:hypothetical protein
MTRYTLIGPDPQTMGQILESESPPEPPGNKHFKWLPIVDDAQPFDPWQQNKTTSYTIFDDYVQETCIITDMKDDELAVVRDANATRMDEVWLQVTFDHENRIRAMEKKQPPVTMRQWQKQIQDLLKEQMQ